MKLTFRELKPEEIDVRVGNVDKNGKYITLLLYKNARVDMDLLDETVGSTNWKRSHSRDNANCTVSIYDEDKKEWVSKEDTGIESNTQQEKGLASDSFKRACVNWGIGRELYTAPQIYINGVADILKKDNYSVKNIEYEQREIKKLVIVNKKGDIVYPKQNSETTDKVTDEQIKKIHTYLSKLKVNEESKIKIYEKFGVNSSKELSYGDALKMIKSLESKLK